MMYTNCRSCFIACSDHLLKVLYKQTLAISTPEVPKLPPSFMFKVLFETATSSTPVEQKIKRERRNCKKESS